MAISAMILSLLLAIWGIEFAVGIYLVCIAFKERRKQKGMKP